MQILAHQGSGGFFSDPLDGTPYETNETTAALILAIAGALFGTSDERELEAADERDTSFALKDRI